MITWAYIAGFLDGDGWITVSQNKNATTQRWTIGFTQSYKKHEFMQTLFEFLMNNGINCDIKERIVMGSIHKETRMINIMIRTQEAVFLLSKKLIPFLVMKKTLAIHAMTYTKNRMKKRGFGLTNKKQKKRIYWKESDDNKLKNLINNGFSNLAIANELNRSIDSVGHRLYRIKLTRNS